MALKGQLLDGGRPLSDMASSSAWLGAAGSLVAQDPEALFSFLPLSLSYKTPQITNQGDW